MIDIDKTGKAVIEIAKQVGDFIIEQRKQFSIEKAEKKGMQDYVSYVDKEAEKQIVAGLKVLIPQAGFIVEEQSASHNNEAYIWIVDPLDGTTNFIHGVTPHAISIALRKDDKVILGVVYELGLKEVFYSWEGIAAFCNDKEISVRQVSQIAEGLISTGFPINDFTRLDKHMQVVKQVVQNSHGVRRHGSAATDLAYIASGRFDGYFEYGLSAWDVAAGAYLVEKAGGKVSDYSGGKNYYFGREMCAGTPGIHKELVNLLKSNML